MNMNLDALQAAISTGSTDEVRSLLAREPLLASATTAAGVSLILWALYQGQREPALAIAASKPDLNVFEAVALGRVEHLATLLRADPARACAVAPDGFPALGLAVFFAQTACAALLLAAGADANQVADNGARVAPIHAACTHQDEALACRLVHLLLAFGADPNQRQQAGWTPLHAAAHRNQPRLIGVLRAAGGDPGAVNDSGASALEIAQSEGRAEAAEALK
jgi:uncharacterized protein